MITINRVDTLGKITGNFEGVVGVISGTNVIDCLRGVEGTAQAWLAGTVVEILFTADNWNDLIDAFLVAFNQDGTIKDSTVLTTPVINTSFTGTAKAASGDITTGTADNLIVTPKGLKDAGLTVTPTSTTTFTNKRINPRIVTAASYTTDTGTALDVSTCDEFDVTAQAGALKLNNPGGTAVAGQKLIVRIKDDGTARALTYDTEFRASSDLALPTTTVLGKTLYMGFMFNATDTKFDLLFALNNF